MCQLHLLGDLSAGDNETLSPLVMCRVCCWMCISRRGLIKFVRVSAAGRRWRAMETHGAAMVELMETAGGAQHDHVNERVVRPSMVLDGKKPYQFRGAIGGWKLVCLCAVVLINGFNISVRQVLGRRVWHSSQVGIICIIYSTDNILFISTNIKTNNFSYTK